MPRGRGRAVRVLRRARASRREPCGKVVVAVRDADLPRLDELERRARENGVPGLRRLGPDELREIEPEADGPGGAALAADRDRRLRRGRRRLRARRRGARRRDPHRRATCARCVDRPDGVEIVLGGRRRDAARAARGHAAAARGRTGSPRASGARVDLRIVPFRGAYLKLRADRTHLVRGQIYPVPDPSLPFLGVHLSRTIGGDVLLGPTALLAGARDAYRLAPRPPRRPRRDAALARHRAGSCAAGGGPARARSPTRPAAGSSCATSRATCRRSAWTTSSPDPRGSGLRPSAATARCSTTSRSPRRRTRCTSSTRRRRPPRLRWRSRSSWRTGWTRLGA